jgi:hypothetical protein
MTTPLLHAERSGEFTLPLGLDHTVALFTPLGEQHWVPGWHPQFCYPPSGLPEEGAVFLTSHGDETPTIWVMTDYMPAEGRLSYTRTTPFISAGIVSVQCTANTPHQTTVHVIYRMTALAEAGNATVVGFAQAHQPNWIATWEMAIRQYLRQTSSIGHTADDEQ